MITVSLDVRTKRFCLYCDLTELSVFELHFRFGAKGYRALIVLEPEPQRQEKH